MILCEPFLYRVLVQCSKLFFHFIKQKHLYYKVIEIRLQIDREHLVSLFVTHFVEQFDLESKVTKLWKMSSLWIKNIYLISIFASALGHRLFVECLCSIARKALGLTVSITKYNKYHKKKSWKGPCEAIIFNLC